MSTKRQVIAALKRVHPEAELIDNCTPGYYDYEAIAPPGHHWDFGPHAMVFHEFDMGDKASFWSRVLPEVKDLRAVACDDADDPCEFVSEGDACEFWMTIDEFRALFK